jgi:hypothetical protein
MATAELTDLPRLETPRHFYLIMAVILTAIVAFGFSHTVPSDLSAPGFPIFLAIHGVIFFAWMLLFIVQPALALRGSVALHRRLGWVGAGLAAAMAVLATGAILLGLWSDHLPSFYPPGLFVLRGFVGVAMFSGLVMAAIALRRRPQWHKRLILCATIIIIEPGLERSLPVPMMGPTWYYAVDGLIFCLAAAGPAVDLLTRRRIHPAYLWGVGAILGGQMFVDLMVPSPLAPMVVHLVGGR